MYKEIKLIYPDILDSEFELQDDGDGVRIVLWTYAGAQPTQQAIADATLIVIATAVIQDQIDVLEAQQTPRRMREAVRDKGATGRKWLDDLDDAIDGLRAQLP